MAMTKTWCKFKKSSTLFFHRPVIKKALHTPLFIWGAFHLMKKCQSEFQVISISIKEIPEISQPEWPFRLTFLPEFFELDTQQFPHFVETFPGKFRVICPVSKCLFGRRALQTQLSTKVKVVQICLLTWQYKPLGEGTTRIITWVQNGLLVSLQFACG